MTTHTFPAAPNERHNGYDHYFCSTCDASKRHATSHHGPHGPYRVRIDAADFRTCEEARAEQERREVESATAWRAIQEKQATHAGRLAEFQATYPSGGCYWVRWPASRWPASRWPASRWPGNPTPFIAFLDDNRKSWTMFGDCDEDSYERGGEYRGFDAVEIVSGPIEAPTVIEQLEVGP